MALTKLGSKNTIFDCSLSVDDKIKKFMTSIITPHQTLLTSLLATDTVDVLITVPQMFSYYTAQKCPLGSFFFSFWKIYMKT